VKTTSLGISTFGASTWSRWSKFSITTSIDALFGLEKLLDHDQIVMALPRMKKSSLCCAAPTHAWWNKAASHKVTLYTQYQEQHLFPFDSDPDPVCSRRIDVFPYCIPEPRFSGSITPIIE
jgi:hypothetical protein